MSFPDYRYPGGGTATYHGFFPGADTSHFPCSNDFHHLTSTPVYPIPQSPTTTTQLDAGLTSIQRDVYDTSSPGADMLLFDPSIATNAGTSNAATAAVGAQNQAPAYAQARVHDLDNLNYGVTPSTNESTSLSPYPSIPRAAVQPVYHHSTTNPQPSLPHTTYPKID
ncbi:hypothetical protein HD806DRAFT_535891 [Xylariaceae sp. AK1471]|nr:hypothetical protein HD806DRAFT_535891 [Xylariaceae sp. AK1471]